MPDQRDFNSQLICDYIKDLNENHSRFTEWNCILLSKGQKGKIKSNFACIDNKPITLSSREKTAQHIKTDETDWVHFPNGFSDRGHRIRYTDDTKPTLLLYHLHGDEPKIGGPFGNEEYVPLGVMILFPDPKVKIKTKRVLADQLLRDEQVKSFENADKYYWADHAF